MQEQSVGGGQHHFEEDEEIEEVAREKGAVEACKEELEQRMEVMSRRVPARHRIGLRGECKSTRQAQHQSRQAIQNEDDAKGGGPVAELVNPRSRQAGGSGSGKPHEDHRKDEYDER